MKPQERTQASARRHFLSRGAGTIAALTILPRHVLGGPRHVAPNERVHVAIVGAGGMGRSNAKSLLDESDARIVAVCDVAEQTDLREFWYGGFAGRTPVRAMVDEHYGKTGSHLRCAEYEDFRLMLEKEKGIDAILCATPDHLHAAVSIAAMRAGKHIYCEKPLTHSIWEARQVARVAKETGVATQMGNQGHSGAGLRLTSAWLSAGLIGKVREVHAWSDAGQWSKGRGRPTDTFPVPQGFNWDLWLGPREHRPYHPAYCPYNWRGWWAFGTGSIGDMACHNMDPAVTALNLEHPLTVEATSTGVDQEVTSLGGMYTYRFEARGDMPPLTMTWYDGGLRPPAPEGTDPDDPRQRLGERGNGILFVGDKGFITCPGWAGMPRLLPLSLREQHKGRKDPIARGTGHHADWLSACKGGPPACSSFGYSARLTELVLLGNVALRTGKTLRWDAPNMRASNAPEAERFIREEYRAGWEIC